jgi:ribosomal protein S18 acetylase RimI-like enzyme/predicted double-glycine peptidase
MATAHSKTRTPNRRAGTTGREAMTVSVALRVADRRDLAKLVEIENICFTSDILSRRSFQRFLRPGAHEIVVAEVKKVIVGYVLVLFRTGTSLARLYSIAVSPSHRGKGIAEKLVKAAEQSGREHKCAFMRLEVSVHNEGASRLYKKLGYRLIGQIENYYDDGSDALRMEKRILSGVSQKSAVTPYYEQSTDFTCGPAALMMGMKTLNSKYNMNRQEELQIWREATTIFMTSGHGGCSPYGLALSAWDRGFSVELYVNQVEPPFIDSVRGQDKKDVVALVHEDFMQRIKTTDIKILVKDITPEGLQSLLHSGHAVVALISTWRLNRNKAPHWVFVANADDKFVYINDPDLPDTDSSWQTETDYIQVPIGIPEFINMTSFGQKRFRSLLVLGRKKQKKKKK